MGLAEADALTPPDPSYLNDEAKSSSRILLVDNGDTPFVGAMPIAWGQT